MSVRTNNRNIVPHSTYNPYNEMMERLTMQMAKTEGLTEVFKAKDQMAWVQHMNSIRIRAEEVVKSGLIYC